MRLRSLVLAAIAGVACAVAAAWLVVTSDHDENKIATLSLALTAGVAFITSGLIAVWRRPENRTGVLLAAVGYLWALGALTESNNDWLFTAGVVLGGLAFGALAHLLLAFPSGVLSTRLDRVLVASTYALLFGTSLALALVEEQPAPDCPDCRSTIAVTSSDAVADAVTLVAAVLGLPLLVTILFVVVRRFVRASPALRRVLAPVLGAGALCVSILLVGVVMDAAGVSPGPLEYVFLASFAMVPIAFLAGLLRSRLARAAAGDLLLELERGRPLRDALADALHDPSLEIAYWLPERERFVSAEGKEIQDGTRTASYVEREGRRVAALLHDPSLAYDPELIETVTVGAGLWLENERLQAELRAQLDYLETVVNLSPSLLCSVTPEGRIANYNVECRIASGREDTESVRHEYFWDVFVSPEEREALRERFEAAAPEHDPMEFECTFVDAAGVERSIAWSTAPIRDESGNARNVIFGGLDVTERKQREVELARERDFLRNVAEDLRSSEERLRAAIDASPVAIVEYALDDTITRWNPAAERIFGWTAAQVVGGPARHQPPGHEEELRELFARVRSGEVYTSVESRRVRKGGEYIDVEISAAPIRDAAGNVLSHMALFADITDRKRHEQEVHASRARIVQAADDARRLLERNLHDGAQQRLVSLSLTLRLAESRLDRPEEAREVLAGAREELGNAIEDLRELARGIHPAVLTDRGLDAAVDALASRSPVPVDVIVPEERLPGAVEAAAYYVVAESLTNVAKYAHASSASVRIHREAGVALIEVSDDGIGGADAGGGTGLSGLADRLAALDGTLAVDSPPGGGTRIRATIPVA